MSTLVNLAVVDCYSILNVHFLDGESFRLRIVLNHKESLMPVRVGVILWYKAAYAAGLMPHMSSIVISMVEGTEPVSVSRDSRFAILCPFPLGRGRATRRYRAAMFNNDLRKDFGVGLLSGGYEGEAYRIEIKQHSPCHVVLEDLQLGQFLSRTG